MGFRVLNICFGVCVFLSSFVALGTFASEDSEIICSTYSDGTLQVNPEIELFHEEIQSILKRGEIVIAVKKGNSPPFFFEENESVYGLDFEIGCALAKELGVQARFVRNQESFNGTVDMVMNEEADLAISKISTTLKRQKKVLFSRPYAQFTHGFLINRERVSAIDFDGD